MERAFVLQIEAEADLAAGKIGGRVEHVTSGRAARFDSTRQLLRFLGAVLFSATNEAAPATSVRDDPEGEGGKKE